MCGKLTQRDLTVKATAQPARRADDSNARRDDAIDDPACLVPGP